MTGEKSAFAKQQMLTFDKADLHFASKMQTVRFPNGANDSSDLVGVSALRRVTRKPKQYGRVGCVAMSCESKRPK